MSRQRDTRAYRVVGGIVPPSLATKIRVDDLAKDSLKPESYHLAIGENLRDGASRSWSYLKGAYYGWREVQESRGGMDDTRAQLTRERWLLLLLRELGYGMVPAAPGGIEVEGHDYPVSHRWRHVPVHLLGPGVELDKRAPRVAGAARQPQAMVQELLNRTDDYLWAIVSNGRRLRLLRDSTELVGSAYIEFDLEAIFDGELFADFFLMWRMVHASRLEKRSGEEATPADCWLESWRTDAHESGTRALNKLSGGVKRALEKFGNGFLSHQQNGWLADALRTGELSRRDYYRALLRLAYRMLFVFVAEDRGALLDPNASPDARARYDDYFSTDRLRRLASSRSGGTHTDLWEAQRLVLRALGGDGTTTGQGEALLGLPPLSGLFDPDRRLPKASNAPDPDLLNGAVLTNHDFLGAVRDLAWFRDDNGRLQRVDYRSMDSEELGSVYESLLENEPQIGDDGTFTIKQLAGNERKTTGSYYTPSSLVSTLLDTALDPLIKRAEKEAVDDVDRERRLLALTVCDPACGSGHFLVASARRIAQKLAEVRSGDDAPSDNEVRHALRDVVSRCIYGVDLNDMAAELAKVSLWMEAMEPGKPLGFLDAHIKVGNSLLGTTPALLAEGVPNEAFKAILTGDDKKTAKAMLAQSKLERSDRDSNQLILSASDLGMTTSQLAQSLRTNERMASDTADEARSAAEDYLAADASPQVEQARQIADAWCSAFVWHMTEDAPDPPHEGWLRHLAEASGPAADDTAVEVARLALRYRFFHWHIEFPEIFGVDGDVGPEGWSGGFSLVCGNPPWEHTELKEKEYFSARDPEIAQASGARRKKLISDLQTNDSALWAAFNTARRHADGVSALSRVSGRYPLTGRGRINTYALFAEADRSFVASDGRLGMIVPTGIATDHTTKDFFKALVEDRALANLYDFENAKPIFEGVHRSFKFCLLTLSGRGERETAAEFAFFLYDVEDLEKPGKLIALSPEEIKLLNPNTGTCPVFRTRRDAEITLGIYKRVPVLIREGDPDGNPWGVSFMQGLFNMTSDSHLFHTRDELEVDGWILDGNHFVRGTDRMLPLYEAKMLHHYDHRWATYERDGTIRDVTLAEKQDPSFVVMPRYWVQEKNVDERLNGRWDGNWLLGWRDICRSTDVRTVVASRFPRDGVGDKFLVALPSSGRRALQALWSSFALDYSARQKIGGTSLKYFTFMQLPIPRPDQIHKLASLLGDRSFVGRRVIELAFTAWDCNSFALEFGDDGPPFRWHVERRGWIHAELDAVMFHLYGIERDDVDYIMDTFPIVKRKDEAQFGEYRTKRLILEVYDEMAEAIKSGEPYQTILNPPPGEGPRHPDSSRPDWAKREVTSS